MAAVRSVPRPSSPLGSQPKGMSLSLETFPMMHLLPCYMNSKAPPTQFLNSCAQLTQQVERDMVVEVLKANQTKRSITDLERKFIQLEQFQQRELQLLDQLKLSFTSKVALSDGKQSKLEEMREIIKKKEQALTSLLENVHDEEKQQVSLNMSISIGQQPAEIAVANRYLVPPPVVIVNSNSPEVLSDKGTLMISARLSYHGVDEEVTKTIDGRQEVLQGIKKVSLDSTGKAIFNKLKIMEVSSKHKHQAFCLIFSLEEHSSRGQQLLHQVKSTPFYVQSRPNKRKSSEANESSMKRSKSQESLKTSSSNLSSPTEEVSSPLSEEEANSSEDSLEFGENGEGEQKDKSFVVNEYNYIDITDLLILPQKEAARRLGISESMLCKRFKECTRRKWPYRYLRKIDKVINMLQLHKSDGIIPKEDREKLEKLTKERDECLRPVKIRITACDKLSISRAPEMPDSDEAEDEIPDDILETLEMMKAQREHL